MHKIENNYEKIRTLFSSNKKSFVFESIIAGFTPGDIYVDNPADPGLYIILDCGNFILYFGGESPNAEDYSACIDFAKENILTGELKENYDEYILISYTSEAWKKALREKLGDSIEEEETRLLFNRENSGTPAVEPIDESYRIQPITEDIIMNKNLKYTEYIREEVESMWGSVDSFLQNGFGSCAVKDNSIISICTAEFLSQKNCGIGIATAESQQKKGIATAVAAHFLTTCAERNLIPHWDCDDQNPGSIKVAEKLGFKKVEAYNTLVVKF